jgi:hypothetical protein
MNKKGCQTEKHCKYTSYQMTALYDVNNTRWSPTRARKKIPLTLPTGQTLAPAQDAEKYPVKLRTFQAGSKTCNNELSLACHRLCEQYPHFGLGGLHEIVLTD